MLPGVRVPTLPRMASVGGKLNSLNFSVHISQERYYSRLSTAEQRGTEVKSEFSSPEPGEEQAFGESPQPWKYVC